MSSTEFHVDDYVLMKRAMFYKDREKLSQKSHISTSTSQKTRTARGRNRSRPFQQLLSQGKKMVRAKRVRFRDAEMVEKGLFEELMHSLVSRNPVVEAL